MLVTSMGAIYRISKAGWLKYCEERATCGVPRDIEDFGGKFLGMAKDITDWSPEEYAFELPSTTRRQPQQPMNRSTS